MNFMDSAILKNQLMIMKALLPLVSDKQLANDLRGADNMHRSIDYDIANN